MSDEALRPFVERPQDAGLFLDFDGTLSDIVPVPADARPVAGAEGLLRDLARHFGLVAIVSGRSAHELAEWLGPDVEIWGAHGAQRARDGTVELAPAVAGYAPLMAAVHTEAR
ncbi:MAG: trehalose-phosphatase, partial [Actinomycetota bacterium]|nr:trehalose-phosphatase [Actinomycetota bacterium]